MDSREFELLVTCSYKGATHYTQYVLLRKGLAVGHEHSDGRMRNKTTNPLDPSEIVDSYFGNCSWFHVGKSYETGVVHCGDHTYKHIWHQIRDPLKVIASTATRNPRGTSHEKWDYFVKQKLKDQRKWNFVQKNIQATFPDAPPPPTYDETLKFYMYLWHYWNLMIEQKAEWRYRIENLEGVWEEMINRLRAMGRPELTYDPVIFDTSSSEYNSKIKVSRKGFAYDDPFTWDELFAEDEKLAEKIQKQAIRYGYTI